MKLLIALNAQVTEKALGPMAFTDYRKCEDYLMSFDLRSLGGWQQLAAEVTKYYGWGPQDAWSLTRTRLIFGPIRPVG